MSEHVTAVVVTWNRRDLLTESLEALGGQTRPLDRIIVVDNASTDGTAQMLPSRFPGVEVITSAENLGGAGGFALAIREAMRRSTDAVWLMDDDTVPTPTALAELLRAREDYAGQRPALVASRVVWTDGTDHPMNTPRRSPFATAEQGARAEAIGCVPVRTASFVSILIDAGRIREVGLPLADYFIWNDDFEYSARIVRGRDGLYCPASVVVHKTAKVARADDDPGPRFFHEVRNKTWLFTRSPGLSPWEKTVYAGATARRWTRVVMRSDDRGTLVTALRRGLSAGLRAGPRPTAQVLARAEGQAGPAHGQEAGDG